MPTRSKDTLKSYFVTGAEPTQAQFGDLIDTMPSASGLILPQPMIHINGGKMAYSHSSGAYIGQHTGSINSNQLNEHINGISLYWQGSNNEFMAYDPHFFLFAFTNKGSRHKSNKRLVAGLRTNSAMVHPANAGGAMFSNFSGGGNDKGSTEWAVPVANRLVDIAIDAHKYYNIDRGSRAAFFPRTITEWNNHVKVSLLSKGSYTSDIVPKKIYLQFAIVIRNPLHSNKYVIGPMSSKVCIRPKCGFFSIPTSYHNRDNDQLNLPSNPDYASGSYDRVKIFYGWQAMIK